MKKWLVMCCFLLILSLIVEAFCLKLTKTLQGQMVITVMIFTTIDLIIILWLIHRWNKETKEKGEIVGKTAGVVYDNIDIFWIRPGYYYYAGSWKFSSNQDPRPETDNLKFFESLEKVREIFTNVSTT